MKKPQVATTTRLTSSCFGIDLPSRHLGGSVWCCMCTRLSHILHPKELFPPQSCLRPYTADNRQPTVDTRHTTHNTQHTTDDNLPPHPPAPTMRVCAQLSVTPRPRAGRPASPPAHLPRPKPDRQAGRRHRLFLPFFGRCGNGKVVEPSCCPFSYKRLDTSTRIHTGQTIDNLAL
ncbi:unnamed protein product, partial [Protopolystoma xenopodis]